MPAFQNLYQFISSKMRMSQVYQPVMLMELLKNDGHALAKHQESYCYSIRESDAKNLCLAQIKNQKSYCYSIKSSDTKNQCLALVK